MSDPRPRDERYMAMALGLARRAVGRTSPNPMVGAVIVRGDEVVGRGFHRRAGTEHAEVVALARAGEAARDAELYVNLEPCNHRGRTGPCTRAIIEAGLRRVVVGMRDPNPLVNGKGVRALRRAGLSVTTGVLKQACLELNAGFISYMSRGRPLVTFKAAITLDGRVAARTGDARWVTGPDARQQGHRMRDRSDVIMVGVGTVMADDPTLTCRGVSGGQDPARVVVDSRLRTPPEANVVQIAAASDAPTIIVTTDAAPRNRARALEQAGAEIIRVPADRGARGKREVPLAAMLSALAEREFVTVLLEGGPRLAGAMWRLGLVDRLTAFLAPKVMGDVRALPMLDAGEVPLMAGATDIEDVLVKRVGGDVMISGRVASKGGPGGGGGG